MSMTAAITGFDLALTEILEDERHYFTVEVGSDSGREMLEEMSCRDADYAEIRTARALSDKAVGRMGRKLDTDDIKELITVA